MATRISELKAGSADLMVGVRSTSGRISKRRCQGHRGPSYRRLFVAIKQGRHPALADVRVRQAMNYAVNCDEIATVLLGGLAKCSIDLVNAPNQNTALKPYTYDPAKAKELLTAAGWVPVQMAFAPKARHPALAEFRHDQRLLSHGQGDCPGHGRFMEGGRNRDRRSARHRQFRQRTEMRAKQGAGYRDLMNSSSGPDYTCQGDLLLVQKDSGSNRMSWVDNTFEQMFKAFNQEFDQTKWKAICDAAQAYVAEQAPVVWMFTEPTFYGVSKRLDYEARPDGRVYLNLVLKGVKD